MFNIAHRGLFRKTVQAVKQQRYSQNGFGVRLQARLKHGKTHCAGVQVRHIALDHLWPVINIVPMTPTLLGLFCLLSIRTHNWTSQELSRFINQPYRTCFDS